MNNANLELRIERLILRDVPAWQSDAIVEAVRAELALLLEGGLPPGFAPGAPISLAGPAVEVPPGASASTIGARLARAIYDGLQAGAGSPLPAHGAQYSAPGPAGHAARS